MKEEEFFKKGLSSEWAKKDYRFLVDDPTGEQMWKDLKANSSRENPYFGQLVALMPPEQWDSLIRELDILKNNWEKEGQDVYGDLVGGEEAFLSIAASLKDLDPERFDKSIGLKQGVWLDLKSTVEYTKEIGEYFRQVHDLQVLYPKNFEAEKFKIPGGKWEEAVDLLRTYMDGEDWENFLELYSLCKMANPEQIQTMIPINKEAWSNLLLWLSGQQDNGVYFGVRAALAQRITPPGFKVLSLKFDDWASFYKQVADELEKTKDIRMFLRRCRGLKYLQVEDERE